jgi:hypothetical protein
MGRHRRRRSHLASERRRSRSDRRPGALDREPSPDYLLLIVQAHKSQALGWETGPIGRICFPLRRASDKRQEESVSPIQVMRLIDEREGMVRRSIGSHRPTGGGDDATT